MQASEFLPQLSESLASNRVYAEPVTHNGVTVIPAAAVRGGGGIRQRDAADSGRGGMGIIARPVGAYVIRDDDVEWKPAIDVSRAIFRGQVIAFTALLVFGLLRSRR